MTIEREAACEVGWLPLDYYFLIEWENGWFHFWPAMRLKGTTGRQELTFTAAIGKRILCVHSMSGTTKVKLKPEVQTPSASVCF